MNIKESFRLIDKPTFFGSLAMLLSLAVLLIIWPERGAEWVKIARAFLVDSFGVTYLLLGLGALRFTPDHDPWSRHGSWDDHK